MSTIKATCAMCGELELRPPALSLFIYLNALDRSYYAFNCPTCQDLVVKGADEEVIGLLTQVEKEGLVVNRIRIPAEVLEEHIGWIITTDDCLDFTLDLRALEFPVAALMAEHQARDLRPTG